MTPVKRPGGDHAIRAISGEGDSYVNAWAIHYPAKATRTALKILPHDPSNE